ncbi:ARM repeat-containing protein [Hanseniaspora valbyensis NRRL Y-1626]|uniref:Importin subunit alpha n=1 Tax=Hanseniaspora valbyensis NRRL Y-1626 TaxID=766949 RepID=A0A1B7TDX1_9ASCO|nr:ARM repeat-containing protein [Hanseniaspora valbyensis NRRL Y-1626]
MDSDTSSASGTNKYVPEYRRTTFKNKNKFSAEELRKRRETQQVELRKTKRDEVLAKRRNMASSVVDDNTQNTALNEETGAVDKDLMTGAGKSEEEYNYFLQEELPKQINNIMSQDLAQQLTGVIALRQMLSREYKPPIREVLDCGILPRLIEFIGPNQPDQLQHESAWAITNLCSGASEDTRIVVESNVLPNMIALMESDNVEVKEQAVWCIGNIAGDSSEYRDLCIQMDVMPLLLNCFELNRASLTKTSVWTLSNICRGRTSKPNWSVVSQALPVISRLIYSYDTEILSDALWTLSYLSDGDDNAITNVLKFNVAPRLVQLLSNGSSQVQTPALRTIGNLLTGDDIHTQTILASRVLEPLIALLTAKKENMRKEACWCFSNILAGTPAQAREVISSGCIPMLLDIIETDTPRCKKEALWCICNACSAGGMDPEIIRVLVGYGVLKTLCLQLVTKDNKLIEIILDSLLQILQVGEADKEASGLAVNEYASLIEQYGGADTIFNLQTHQSEIIYNKSFKLIDTYFSGEEEEEEAALNDEMGNSEFRYNINEANQQNFQF